jgi:hypothetical protein
MTIEALFRFKKVAIYYEKQENYYVLFVIGEITRMD